MNYESDKKSLVDRLKENNQTALTEMENEPYRPVVYALTENQLECLMSLLKTAAEFQPELYEQILPLATKDQTEGCFIEMQRMTTSWAEEILQNAEDKNAETLREMNRLLGQMQENTKQDGKNHAAFILKISEAIDSKITALESVISGLRRRIVQILCGTAVASVLLSLAVCLLLRG